MQVLWFENSVALMIQATTARLVCACCVLLKFCHLYFAFKSMLPKFHHFDAREMLRNESLTLSTKTKSRNRHTKGPAQFRQTELKLYITNIDPDPACYVKNQ